MFFYNLEHFGFLFPRFNGVESILLKCWSSFYFCFHMVKNVLRHCLLWDMWLLVNDLDFKAAET